jgi:uncharacterized phage protein (TIGR01671 family)
MREIKFRAWLRSESKMCDIMVMTFGVGAFLIGAQPGADYLTSDGKSMVFVPTNGRFCNSGEFELIQYTGLEDRNGNKIFEGDLLIAMSENVGVMTVYYESGAFYCKNKYNKWGLLSRCFDADIQKLYSPFVVGNIYENPELLK